MSHGTDAFSTLKQVRLSVVPSGNRVGSGVEGLVHQKGSLLCVAEGFSLGKLMVHPCGIL